jgi:hypothetical protein
MYEPLFRHRPRHKWTNGDLAARVAEDLGLPPDDEQRWIYDTIYAESAPDRPASFEVGVISPRQNIKTSSLGVAALADLFVFGVERHLWTAHHGDTLKGTFNDFRSWIKSNPEYDEQVTFYEGHQDMSIVHKDTGNTIDFQSRTGKAGRGLTGVKRITLDEALYLEPKHVGAVYPTMLTRPGAQVRIASSAGLVDSEQLRRLRDRGRAGKDARMAWVEYGAERSRACEATARTRSGLKAARLTTGTCGGRRTLRCGRAGSVRRRWRISGTRCRPRSSCASSCRGGTTRSRRWDLRDRPVERPACGRS